MKEEYDIIDFENVLLLKNQLLNAPFDELREYYKDYDNYLAFLDAVAVLANTDSGFLLFYKDGIDKISRILQLNRFNIKDDAVREIIDSIITFLNRTSSYDERYENLVKLSYLTYQEDSRITSFDDEETFLSSISYDAIAYFALKDGNFELITADDLFLASVNYLFVSVPEFFKDPLVQERLITILDKIDKTRGFSNRYLRKYSKYTRKAYQKIKDKEE
jgi:hypothetical protein